MSSDNIPDMFLTAMRLAGFEPDCTIVADGRLHRFRDWLDKPATRNGWYVLFRDFPPAGAFGCWKRGMTERWSGPDFKAKSLMTRRFAAIENVLAVEHEKGRQQATEMWQKARPANGKHRYLLSKKVGAHGIRYLYGALLIPIMDVTGQLHGLQRIYHDGSKRYTFATNKRGHFYMIGTPSDNIICIAEGFATAATIHQVTGNAVAVAFDAGNLMPVAVNLRTEFPSHQFVLCADDDRRVGGNPGMTKAREAAEFVGGWMVFPRFYNPLSSGTDFNDLFNEAGEDAVKRCISLQGESQYVSHK
ncbi:MAG: toprim domain-containing protein [Geobacteraceae bacterium]|nr:toprim domain-containing protein [Geobacteraceae bacterium]